MLLTMMNLMVSTLSMTGTMLTLFWMKKPSSFRSSSSLLLLSNGHFFAKKYMNFEIFPLLLLIMVTGDGWFDYSNACLFFVNVCVNFLWLELPFFGCLRHRRTFLGSCFLCARNLFLDKKYCEYFLKSVTHMY